MDDLNEILKDKCRGCLVGGAVGDALGYAVEFMSEASIKKRYGARGITEYTLTNGVAEISDDTQMTLFTAGGLLLGADIKAGRDFVKRHSDNIALSYKDWYRTQTEKYPIKGKHYSCLLKHPELFDQRAPGGTCMSALSSLMKGVRGSISNPVNTSKGCGGVMRVAPIGVCFSGKAVKIEEIDMLAAEAAAITHGHDLGYIPAAALAHIIHIISHRCDVSLADAVNDMIRTMQRLFSEAKHICDFTDLMRKAVDLSSRDIADIDAIHILGEGWVAEETLAIAIYSALKYSNDFEGAMIAAVNHNGDSDSTGAVTGNILGAYLGMRAISRKYLDNLELKSVILELSDALYNFTAAHELFENKRGGEI